MRIVIKAGTNLLTGKTGELDRKRISSLAREIAELRGEGCEAVIVTSGAIGAGMGRMKLHKRPSSLKEKQALAAIGQPLLMDIYQNAFKELKITIAQVLLTRADFDDRQKYINAQNTLLALLKMGTVPIINENDTVAVEEINFGDNDTLSALVASALSADWLFMLTDVEGLYRGAPGKGELVSRVEKISRDIEKHASEVSGSGKGTGGMKTKVLAAKIATSSGVQTVIANGLEDNIIAKILAGENRGTTFLPAKAIEARKHWIAFGSKCKGSITVDEGAAKALLKGGKSLLPSGITAAGGAFKAGDTVSILNNMGGEIARGVVSYSCEEIEKIKGRKSADIKKILSKYSADEVIHRDDLVVLEWLTDLEAAD